MKKDGKVDGQRPFKLGIFIYITEYEMNFVFIL